MKKTMFILGATGFVGSEVVRVALAFNWNVKALVRSQEAFDKLRGLGVSSVLGDAYDPGSWASEMKGVDVLIDLLQPEIPIPFRSAKVKTVSEERQRLTRGILDSLKAMPLGERPAYLSVSGTDDLMPDENGVINSASGLVDRFTGFAHIGVPVRWLVEASGVAAIFVNLGTVYGPGKLIAEVIVPRLANGKWRMIGDGSNRMPLVHVEDAARALVHLAGLDRSETLGRTYVLAEASRTSSRELFEGMAEMMGVKRPGSVPKWLASLVSGKILVETMSHDLIADPTGLIDTGFTFKFPSYKDGMPPTLKKLGY